MSGPAQSTKSASTISSSRGGRSDQSSLPSMMSTTTTPTSSSTSKISMSSSFLPYQYRREVQISTGVKEPLPSRNLDVTYRPIRLGLGSAAGNLRTQHVINSKKDSLVTTNMDKKKVFIRGSAKLKSSQASKSFNLLKTTPGGDPGTSITSRMKMLTIYESPKSSNHVNRIGDEAAAGKSTSCRINPTDSVCGKVFLTLNKKANYLAALNRKATFSPGGRPGDSLVILPTKKPNDEESNRAISNLCRHFRNILGWKLSIHLNWKYAEEKIKSWYAPVGQSSQGRMSIKEVAELLKIPEDKLRSFEFDPDMEHCFKILRKNLCHTTCPSKVYLLV